MRDKATWLLRIVILPALLLVSCAPAVSEAEVKPVAEQEEVVQVLKEESVKAVEEPQPKESQTQESQVEEAQSQETQPQKPQVEEAQPQEAQPQKPQPEEPRPIPEEVAVPVHKYQELAIFALELINRDRAANGLDSVVLAGNIASQNHAEENLSNGTSSHWGIDGLKPYMRYTLAGGVNYLAENVIGTGVESGGGDFRDPKEMLEQAQERFMDSPGHRANILNKWHKKVSLGIAYDGGNFHLVQNFEGNYIAFSDVPSISSSILSMNGIIYIGDIEQIVLRYDPLPQPLNPGQLNAPPYDSSYSPGGIIGNILPPPPPGSSYTDLLPSNIVAMTWDTKADGSFTIEADISQILGEGNGVYTVEVIVETDGEFISISNYSIFVQ